MPAAAVRSSGRPPTVSIVILTRHRPQRLERCLDGAGTAAGSGVSRDSDSAQRRGRRRACDVRCAATRRVRVLESPVNLGFAARLQHGGGRQRPGGISSFSTTTPRSRRDGWSRWWRLPTSIPGWAPLAVASCFLMVPSRRRGRSSGRMVRRWAWAGESRRSRRPFRSFVDVDYCSACSLLVRREAWDAVGGFCEDYFPAYYEDVDFCLSIRALGYRVLYAPRSRVRHHEGGSSDPGFRLFLHRYQRRRFRHRWGHVLRAFEPPNPESAAAVRRAAFRARGCPRRLLVIDDRLPDPTIGSGFGRMRDAVVELSEAGYAVSVWSSHGIN